LWCYTCDSVALEGHDWSLINNYNSNFVHVRSLQNYLCWYKLIDISLHNWLIHASMNVVVVIKSYCPWLSFR
jgi:hypothetical protein